MKYTGNKLKEISFPLGGIGSGSIGLAGNGNLVDWEIFNRPSKGSLNGYSGFYVRAEDGDGAVTRALCGDLLSEFSGHYGSNFGQGARAATMCAYPHFKNVTFDGEFPIATVDFEDETFPALVRMTAFNPFIPGDEDASSIPAAFFEIELFNRTDREIDYRVAASLQNPFETSINRTMTVGGRQLIKLSNSGAEPDSPRFGDLTLACDSENAEYQSYWYRGGWCDRKVMFMNEFAGTGHLSRREYDEAGNHDICAISVPVKLGAGEKKKLRFIISWSLPNCEKYWDEDEKKPIWRNYYASLFRDSVASAVHSLDNWDSLFERTLAFKTLLHGSTLPQEIIDAASANLAVLKSSVVLRLEDGSFYGWEGVNENWGSCEGTCQHVWNYAYALCFLFPRLERSIRDLEFKYSTDENGRMSFRLGLPTGRPIWDFRACVDGQMGAVIKCYREWKLSGDDKWLEENWENIKFVLEYAWSDKNADAWDRDRDGVLEGRQHHTLDMELFGPSSWLEGFYLAALRAASEMAEYLGDTEKAREYTELFEKGRKWTKENLFNGRYFIQKIDLEDKSMTDRFGASGADSRDFGGHGYWNDESGEIKYQIGEGCEIDQLLAQWHADMLGLGDIFDREQTDTALCEMMKNNYKPSMRYFANLWRVFCLGDEAGTVICDYPEDARKPKIPIPYTEETMTGFEYAFAGLLFSRGRFEDGMKVVRAVRDRYDGEKRNPWNEIECGNNYSRSMASYAFLPILSGFRFDLPHGYIGFKPYDGAPTDFGCIWSAGGAFGGFEKSEKAVKVSVTEGEITLSSLGLEFLEEVKSVRIDGKEVPFGFESGVIKFDKTTIKESIAVE